MTAYYPNLSRKTVEVNWGRDSDWTTNFDVPVPISLGVTELNTITLTANGGRGRAAGSATGDGNDRRFYPLKNFKAKNGEIQASFDTAVVSGGQLGLGCRQINNQMVVGWTNVAFGASGQFLNGVWVWRTSNMDLNQGSSVSGFKTNIITASGDGATFTVISELPHGLETGDLVDLTNINAGLPNAGACTVTNAFTFTVASAVTGPFTTGAWMKYGWMSRANAKVRLINDIMESKQWFPWEGEPPWGDPLRTVTNVLPATLADGQALNAGKGNWGILINHLGSTVTVDVSNVKAVSYD